MRKLPPLNAIRAFEAAARHQSFTAAAAELCVSVTAVSHQVRQLEALLQRKLFDRRGRTVALTSEGRAIFPLLRDGFDQLANAFAGVQPRAGSQEITLSTTRAFAERWLVPRLEQFSARFPAIIVHIDATEDIVTQGTRGVDLAIRYGRSDGAEPAAVLFEDSYIAVAASGICPRNVASPRIDDLATRSLLAFRWKNPTLEFPAWSGWLAIAPRGRRANFAMSWFSEETLALHAAERGLGPLLCSDALVDDQLRQGTMRQIEGPVLPGFAFRLVEGPSVGRQKAVATFTDWLRAEAESFRARSLTLREAQAA
ncbi:MAG: LysR substrate-binding domain-containing protein [Bradyrhizobium sp.]|uniref:LysR family transcriptional regulator n=1 Tax=Bradyrhizobium sp. TaxID=376 RepID=UPI0029B44A71|nr:LysR family transcriptional regulator [Bradyrhizobium sp.]MDX3966602.1 LysR substrate-binding domain-containing protein [Bradyrhizobium sp.]